MPSTTDIATASRPESKPAGARTTAILLAAGQSTGLAHATSYSWRLVAGPWSATPLRPCSPAASMQ